MCSTSDAAAMMQQAYTFATLISRNVLRSSWRGWSVIDVAMSAMLAELIEMLLLSTYFI